MSKINSKESKILIFQNELSEYNDGFGSSTVYVYETKDGEIEISEPHWGGNDLNGYCRREVIFKVDAEHADKVKNLIDYDYTGYGLGAMFYETTGCFYSNFCEALVYGNVPFSERRA